MKTDMHSRCLTLHIIVCYGRCVCSMHAAFDKVLGVRLTTSISHVVSTLGRTQLAMTSMFVPEPVMSLAITPKKSKKGGGSDTTDKFSKVTTTLLLV